MKMEKFWPADVKGPLFFLHLVALVWAAQLGSAQLSSARLESSQGLHGWGGSRGLRGLRGLRGFRVFVAVASALSLAFAFAFAFAFAAFEWPHSLQAKNESVELRASLGFVGLASSLARLCSSD